MRVFLILIGLMVWMQKSCYSQNSLDSVIIVKPTIRNSDLSDNVMDSLKVYTLEEDDVWRSRYETGEIEAEGGEIRNKFGFNCFCFYKKMEGEWHFFSKDGKLIRTVEF